MDNDFKRQTPRPYNLGPRPMQPSVHRQPLTPRNPTATPRPAQSFQGNMSANANTVAPQAKPVVVAQNMPSGAHISPVQPKPQPVFTPANPITTQEQTSVPPETQAPNTLNFEPPKKSKQNGKLKKLFFTILPITIIVVAIIGLVIFIGNSQKTLNEQKTQITTLESQLRSAQQTNLDLNRQIATLPGITIGLTQAEQNNVTSAISSGNYSAIKPFLIENNLVILAGSDGIGRRSPSQAVKDLEYLKTSTQPWNFALDTTTLDNYRDGDYAQYFPEGAIIGKSADGKVVSLSTTTTGQISVIFMAPDDSML